jgi:hypothetical protein
MLSKAKFEAVPAEFDSWQWLGEDVGHVVLSRAEGKVDVSIGNLLADKVIFCIKVLAARSDHVILGYFDAGFVVTVESIGVGWLEEIQLFEKGLDPEAFGSGMVGSNILGIGR